MNVGFVGTGTMGAPMLGNLLKKGFGVIAYDVVPAALANAEKRGATRAESGADAARRSDLVVTMLPSSSHVESAYLGKNGIAEGLTRGRLCVDMSTIDPAVSRRVAAALEARGVRFIDAPVSGGVPRAEDGTLAIMVGGAARDVSEAFRIAEGFGVDAKILTDVISKSSGNTWVMQFMHPVPGLVAKSASSNDYAPGFMTDLMAKDLGLAVNAARELRVPVVVAPAAQQVLRLASSHGLGRRDFTSVYLFLKPSGGDAPV